MPYAPHQYLLGRPAAVHAMATCMEPRGNHQHAVLGVAAFQCLGLISASCCAQHPTPAVPWPPHKATRGKKCPHLPQPSSETGLEQSHHARCPYAIAGITSVPEALVLGCWLAPSQYPLTLLG